MDFSSCVDHASDFALPNDGTNIWLTPEERALLLKKQQLNLKKLEAKDSRQRRRVLTIDMANKKVGFEVADAVISDDEDDEDDEDDVLSATVNSGNRMSFGGHRFEKAGDGGQSS